MNKERVKKAVTTGVQRHLPSTTMAVEIAKATDWWGKCRLCGTIVEGTLAEVTAHRCIDDPPGQ